MGNTYKVIGTVFVLIGLVITWPAAIVGALVFIHGCMINEQERPKGDQDSNVTV